MAPVSVLILTLNEEVNLPRCLASVGWSDDIVVFDSLSTDKTVELATAAGARVIQRPFDDWSTHQNFAVENIPFKHPWVLYIDADEVVTPELAAEIAALAQRDNLPEVAFRVRRRDMFQGRWLKRSSMYPVWLLRFFRPQQVRWQRLVNPVAVVDGPVGLLDGHLLHYSFNKGIDAWLHKHHQYARLEALEALKSIEFQDLDLPGLVAFSDPVRRRRAIKTLSFRLPFRPLLRFLYTYIFRLGFLDGRPGLTYCQLMFFYEHFIVLNMREILRRNKGLPL